MSFSIDSTDVNSRIDWRHEYVAGPVMGREEHQYPGVSGRWVAVGVEQLPDVIVTGYLEGVGGAGPDAELEDLAPYRVDGTHTIAINGQSFPNMELLSLRFTGPATAGTASSGSCIRPVEMIWRQLTPPPAPPPPGP